MLHGSSVGCTEVNLKNAKVSPKDLHARFCFHCTFVVAYLFGLTFYLDPLTIKLSVFREVLPKKRLSAVHNLLIPPM